MSNHHEIAALVYAYAERLDAGDLNGVASLFAHAGYGPVGGPMLHGTASVRAAFAIVMLHDGIPRTKHVTTNTVIEVDDTNDTATARSYFTVFQATATLPLQAIVAGRYHDRFDRVDGAWRFAERAVHIDLVGDVSQHLHASLPTER